MNKLTLSKWSEWENSEKPALELLTQLNYTHLEGQEFIPSDSHPERKSFREVLLKGRLTQKIREFNPRINDYNITQVIRKLTIPSTASTIQFNKTVWEFLTIPTALMVEQDLGDGRGRRNHAVKLIDWDEPQNNDLLCVNQFKIKSSQATQGGIPDIIIFINGIPLVVIECKSPLISNPLTNGIKDLKYYQKHFPKLFYYNQILIASCGQSTRYGVIHNKFEHFKEWNDPYPLTPDKLSQIIKQTGRKSTTPTPQDILLYGLLEPHNLLDLIRNFIVFEKNTQGRLIKKLGRYQQFRAVKKTLNRILTSSERGGTIWHTQGSGKSLTMLFTAVELRREPKLENPLILFVSDRVDLVGQLQETFTACGFPNIVEAANWQHLIDLIENGQGQTVFTTIQKFRKRKTTRKITRESDEEDDSDEFEEETGTIDPERICKEFIDVNTSKNIIVLVDEAHRSQYKLYATCMQVSMPNAFYIAYTGTPLARTEQNELVTVGKGKTVKKFGSFIDVYNIRQAIDDQATVHILYESRMPKLLVEGESLDKIFERVFTDKSEEDQNEIKKKYGTKRAVVQAKQRVQEVCQDIIDHYEKFIAPNRFKAQIVVGSRKLTRRYKYYLDLFHGPESAITISETSKKNVDLNDLDLDEFPLIDEDEEEKNIPYFSNRTEQKNAIDRFKDPDSSLKFLIVCDMLLTGFDAPVEQVMYLDKSLREHNLLQAIARVNRTNEGKTYGLIVDYYGVSLNLEEALNIFDSADVEGVMTPIENKLPLLEQYHKKVMGHLEGLDKTNLEELVLTLLPEDKKNAFYADFKHFAITLDIILPNPRGEPYLDDLKFLEKIISALRARTRDEQLNIKGCGKKVEKLIDDHIRSLGIIQLVEPVPILSDEFFEAVNKFKSPKSRASEMEHAIRHEISVKTDQDPTFYESLSKRLKQIIDDYNDERITLAEKINLLKAIVDEIRANPDVAKQLGLNTAELAFFNLFKKDLEDLNITDEKAVVTFTYELLEQIESFTLLVDWGKRSHVIQQIRSALKTHIRNLQKDWSHKFDNKRLNVLAQEVVTLAKTHFAN